MRPELVADDVVVPAGVTGRPVDDVDEDACPFDVTQERVTETGAAACALDQPRDVGDRRATLVEVAEIEHTEIRLERRERIVGDLRRSCGDCSEGAPLPRVRQADQADVCDEAELQADPCLGSRLALLGMLRSLVGRRLEMRVAEAASPPARDYRALADCDEIRDELPGLVEIDSSPGRDVEGQVLAGFAVPSRSRAPTAGRRTEVMPVVEVTKRRLTGIDAEVDRATPTSIAAIG